jgi:hypothetical protein
MKNLPGLLIVISALIMVVALVSRITLNPIMGIESRAMTGLAAIMLLFAIALSVKK